MSFAGLAGGEPDLVGDDCHHEYQVEAEGPEEHELWAFEVAAGNGVFFRFDELVGFEGGEDPGLVGWEWVCGVFFHGHVGGAFTPVALRFLSPLRGSCYFLRATHGLRRGLHSAAAPRLEFRLHD